MDYEETLLQLDSIVGTWAMVYPAVEPEPGEEPKAFGGGGLWAAGRLERERESEQGSATARRGMMAHLPWYRERVPYLDLGEDAPLESYERQVAYYTLEGMDDDRMTRVRIGDPGQGETHDLGGFVSLSLWRHEFVESRWIKLPARPGWLWIRTGTGGLVVAADFPNAPTAPGD